MNSNSNETPSARGGTETLGKSLMSKPDESAQLRFRYVSRKYHKHLKTITELVTSPHPFIGVTMATIIKFSTIY